MRWVNQHDFELGQAWPPKLKSYRTVHKWYWQGRTESKFDERVDGVIWLEGIEGVDEIITVDLKTLSSELLDTSSNPFRRIFSTLIDWTSWRRTSRVTVMTSWYAPGWTIESSVVTTGWVAATPDLKSLNLNTKLWQTDQSQESDDLKSDRFEVLILKKVKVNEF